jgi:hypothetical protein
VAKLYADEKVGNHRGLGVNVGGFAELQGKFLEFHGTNAF